MRRWLLMAIVATAGLGGSLSAHLAGALSHGAWRETAEVTHGSLGFLPAVLSVGAVVLSAMLLRRRAPARVFAVSLAASPVIAFVLQERLERLLSAESSPSGAGLEPGPFGAAVALLPWIVAALLVARAVAAIARVVVSGTGSGNIVVPPAVGPELAPVVSVVPARGHDSILDRPPRAPPHP